MQLKNRAKFCPSRCFSFFTSRRLQHGALSLLFSCLCLASAGAGAVNIGRGADNTPAADGIPVYTDCLLYTSDAADE